MAAAPVAPPELEEDLEVIEEQEEQLREELAPLHLSLIHI